MFRELHNHTHQKSSHFDKNDNELVLSFKQFTDTSVFRLGFTIFVSYTYTYVTAMLIIGYKGNM